jgi:undecaprenyl-diphosphatase
MPPIVAAALLGILQGLTEFLPISSTAHLLIARRILGYSDPGEAFTVMIQFGSILAVMSLYRLQIVETVRGLPSRPDARRFAAAILVAFVPALVAGAVFADFIKSVLYQSIGVIATAFIAGGIVMLALERFRRVPTVVAAQRTPMIRALGIGLCQTLALVPGVSRSGATIIGGLIMGLDRVAAAEFSFFLAMPTMVGAFVYELMEVRAYLTPERAGEIAVGFVMAFLAAMVVVKPFLRAVTRRGFAPFAWYRIAAGIVLLGMPAP